MGTEELWIGFSAGGRFPVGLSKCAASGFDAAQICSAMDGRHGITLAGFVVIQKDLGLARTVLASGN